MANPTTGFGLQFSRRLDAAGLSAQIITRRIAYNESSLIGNGDLVEALVDGYIEAYTAGDSAVVLGGVFRGCKYLDPAVGYTRWYPNWSAPTLPSTTIVEAFIECDERVVYTIRSAGGEGTAMDISDIGANFEVTVGTPNALTGMSTTTLLNTPATTATFPLKCVGLYQGVPSSFNDPTLVNNVVEVKLNNLQWFQTAGITT